MTKHEIITKMTEVKVYFADPHSPGQRGTNENTNGLIRQYFPKGTDFNKISKKEIKRVQDLLNERPRKTLDGLTPFEAFDKIMNKCSVKSWKPSKLYKNKKLSREISTQTTQKFPAPNKHTKQEKNTLSTYPCYI